MPTLKETLETPLSRIMSMSKNELRIEVQRLSMEANKRLAYFKRQGISSPATAYIKKHGGRFTSKDKDLTQLREEYQRAKGFLETQTSTVKGYRQWENKVADTLKQNAGIDYNSLTEEQKRKFWRVYAKLEELDQANVYNANYRGSVNAIYDAVKGGLKMKQIDEFVTKLDDEIYRQSVTDLMTGENNPFNV